MKKILLALTAAAAFTGSALAADLPARTYTKAPPPIMAPSWTGFYIFGGAGGGVWDSNTYTQLTGVGTALTIGQHTGGDGWFGTVGAGYDWQFNSSWVAGILADGPLQLTILRNRRVGVFLSRRVTRNGEPRAFGNTWLGWPRNPRSHSRESA